MDCSPPGSSVHGILQAGILEWVAISYSRGFSPPKDRTHVSLSSLLHWAGRVFGIAKSRTWLSDFTFTFHFPALEKEMATHSSVLAWRIPGTGEPGGLPSMRLHRVGHDWSDLAAAAAASPVKPIETITDGWKSVYLLQRSQLQTVLWLYLLSGPGSPWATQVQGPVRPHWISQHFVPCGIFFPPLD